jgi:hypothetical protein
LCAFAWAALAKAIAGDNRQAAKADPSHKPLRMTILVGSSNFDSLNAGRKLAEK